MRFRVEVAAVCLFVAGLLGPIASASAQTATPEEVRTIAREATIYGFPMVDNYRVQYSYFVDQGGPEYKAGWNTLVNTARVYTPADTAIQTPNSDTPYSFIGADLRAEALVLTVPEVEKDRYYSLQFIDQYTFDFAYVGSRATGNEAGRFLLAGPGWTGETPPGINEVIRSETDFAFVLYRTQLFGPDDLPNVEKVQAGYKVEPLSAYLGQPVPAAAPAIQFIKPLTTAEERNSLEFFNVLNFITQFTPTDPSETDLRQRFAKVGIEPGKTIDFAAMAPEMRQAFQDGMADAWAQFDAYKTGQIDTLKVTSADLFGTRAFLKNDYMARMAGAVLGIYGNYKEEALYPSYAVGPDGKPLDGANRYTLRFAPGQMPPVNAFWSLTMYEMPQSLLSANPINRYLINSPMLPELQKDADGGLTLYIQHEMPAKGLEANWLPAPEGPFAMAMRLYWPKPEALDGSWKPPVLEVLE